MLDALSGSSTTSSIDQYIQLAMEQASQPKYKLQTQINTLTSKKTVLSSLDSKLTRINSIMERFTDPITDYFSSKSAQSSDTDKFTVSSTYSASAGNHELTVERLAKSDTRVSKQYSSDDSSFGSFTTDQTFTLEMGHLDDDDVLNRLSFDITVSADTFLKTDEEVLLEIADKINSAMYDAASDETIDSEEMIHASVVSESSGSSRLVLRSGKSGYDYRMDFTDSNDGLLSALEVTNSVASTGTSGGYITEVGTSATDSMLNSKFTIDGLDFYRNSNSVSDAIGGITINLKSTFDAPETITINNDEDSVKTEVQSFIDAYNEALDFLKNNTQMNTETYESGPLSNDLTYRGIYASLRNMVGSTVDSVTNSDYSRLYHIGIEIDDNGKLKIDDEEKFSEALAANPKNISDIFNSENGLANKFQDYLESYIKTGGTIDSSKKNIDSNVISINDRIALINDQLTAKEKMLRNEFTQMQNIISQLNSQQSFLSSFSIY
ncbi:MAG: flagellar filament capping protein FliD [Candidatus Marinimicrobia bacterium]|nr:flagellar filament capping protein FliD [Candidatus Neomarinimicrobiota bacterium]